MVPVEESELDGRNGGTSDELRPLRHTGEGSMHAFEPKAHPPGRTPPKLVLFVAWVIPVSLLAVLVALALPMSSYAAIAPADKGWDILVKDGSLGNATGASASAGPPAGNTTNRSGHAASMNWGDPRAAYAHFVLLNNASSRFFPIW